MRKFLLFLLLTSISIISMAQEPYTVEGKNIIFTRIIENTGLSQNEAYNALSVKFGELWNESKATIITNSENCIAHKGFVHLAYFNLQAWEVKAEIIVRADIKDNRVRLKVTTSTAEASSSQFSSSYYFVDAIPFTNKRGKNIPKKATAEAYATLVSTVENMLNTLEKSLKENKAEENW